MSAFVLSPTHIDALLSAAKDLSRPSIFSWYFRDKRRELTYYPDPEDEDCDSFSAVGRMLIAENVRSVSYRYATKTELPGPNDQTGLRGDYQFRELPGYPDPVVTLKAIDCYEYQSCETPDWEDSEAFAFCRALRRTCIHKLAGYDDAPWCIDDRQVFVQPRRVA